MTRTVSERNFVRQRKIPPAYLFLCTMGPNAFPACLHVLSITGPDAPTYLFLPYIGPQCPRLFFLSTMDHDAPGYLFVSTMGLMPLSPAYLFSSTTGTKAPPPPLKQEKVPGPETKHRLHHPFHGA